MEKVSFRPDPKEVWLSFDQATVAASELTTLLKRSFWNLLSGIAQRLVSYHERRHLYFKNMTKNLNARTMQISPSLPRMHYPGIAISPEILSDVIRNLNDFENQKGYLDKDISLNSLAKQLGTNHSYLSKIINQIKHKSFKHYLNDLRIAHAYEELQQDALKRRYTIEAIAFDNGFRSAESFSKKFKERYGLYPSQFLKELAA